MKAKVIGAMAAAFFMGWLAGTARADFTLHGDEQLTVDTESESTPFPSGYLYDFSRVNVVGGGAVTRLYAYDSSTVNISGGNVSWATYGGIFAHDSSTVNISSGLAIGLDASDASTVNISGGGVGGFRGAGVYGGLDARGTSIVNISDGSVNWIRASDQSTVNISGGWIDTEGFEGSYGVSTYGTSTVNISGGWMPSQYNAGIDGGLYTHDSSTVDISCGDVALVRAYDSSIVTFDGQDFLLGTGLSLDGDKVMGTGILSGKWFDGTAWSTSIPYHAAGATIRVVPEPATLSLLALGGLAMIRRRGKK